MGQKNLTVRERNPSGRRYLHAAGEPTIEGFDNVAGGSEGLKLLLKFDMANNRRSSLKTDQSSSLANHTEHPRENLSPDGDYSNYRDPTLSGVGPKCRRKTDKEGILEESFFKDTTDTTCACIGTNKPSKMSTVVISAYAATGEAPKRLSMGPTQNPVHPSGCTENTVPPTNKDDSDLEPLLQDLANLEVSGTVQSESYSEASSRAFQISRCVMSSTLTTCTGSNLQNHPSASGISVNRATPTVTLESAATSVGSWISDLHRCYGSKMSIVISLNSDDQSLPFLLEALHSSMQAFRGHPNSVMMFHTVNERQIVLTLPKIRIAIIDLNHLVQDYKMENNRASSRAKQALEHIYSRVRWLFEDLHPIDNEIQAALSMLEDEWGPTG